MYIRKVLRKILYIYVNSLDNLLPWSATIPENCKAPTETEAEKLESA